MNEDSLSFIYLIQCETTRAIKIGYSGNPIRRLYDLQCGCPSPLVLLHHFPDENVREKEKQLHKLFKSDRIHGEWFRPENILDYFNLKHKREDLSVVSYYVQENPRLYNELCDKDSSLDKLKILAEQKVCLYSKPMRPKIYLEDLIPDYLYYLSIIKDRCKQIYEMKRKIYPKNPNYQNDIIKITSIEPHDEKFVVTFIHRGLRRKFSHNLFVVKKEELMNDEWYLEAVMFKSKKVA